MTIASRLVIASGLRHWLPAAGARLRNTFPTAQVLVAVFQEPTGRIGFDLNEEGEKIFSQIIGEAYSWSPKETCVVRYSNGVPTGYVRSLFVQGLSQPITVAVSPLQAALDDLALSKDVVAPPPVESILSLAKLDVDEDGMKFAEGVASLAMICNRVCVHSVAQWDTVVVATNGPLFLSELKKLCVSLKVDFSHVSNESLLPQW